MSRERFWRYGAPTLAGAFGLLWFLANGGGQKIVPTRIGWAMSGDWGQHVLGWEMFRNAPWGFPLGKLPNVAVPMGTYVGYTDANPWVAVLLKPFAHWLPVELQYVGPFIALSFALAGVFGALLVRQLTPRPSLQVLGSALFALAPVLLKREGHDTLTAHWLLIAVMWLYFRPASDPKEARRTLAWMIGLNVAAAGIHPTLAAMVAVLSLALVLRIGLLDRAVPRWETAAWTGGVLAAVLGVFALFGYFTVHDREGAEFGRFSSDLLTLVNPADSSHWLPGLPRGPGQYEGYGYLGLGVLVLGLVAIAGAIRSRRTEPDRRLPILWPLMAACGGMALFALSNKVTWAGRQVLSLEAFYRPLAPLVTPFRSSGRFIWPLHYALIALAIAGVIRGFSRWPRALALGLLAVVCAQWLEIGEGWNPKFGDDPDWGRFRSPVWALAQGHYRTLALYPTVMFNGDWRGCTSEFSLWDVLAAGHAAYRLGLRFNSMYLSRADWNAMLETCDAFGRAVRAGQFDAETVYLIAPQRLNDLRPYADALTCGVLDRHVACVRSGNRDLFAQALAQARAVRGN